MDPHDLVFHQGQMRALEDVSALVQEGLQCTWTLEQFGDEFVRRHLGPALAVAWEVLDHAP